ncbi:sensor histidine kinase [Streptomyces sp. NPDC051018]|uniref:sensor histidine kinase n=1 Tax=Streptomyces sp. NPDC051018 TaxID=3365639 RepID=UPI0037BBEC33
MPTGARTGAPRRGESLGDRVLTAVSRDPLSAPHRARNDLIIAGCVGVFTAVLAHMAFDGRGLDALGWFLLAGVVVPLIWRRSHPFVATTLSVVFVGPYHALDYSHVAPLAASLIALYTLATIARPLHTFFVGAVTTGIALSVMFIVSAHQGVEALRTSGWIIAVLFVGVDVRIYRRYFASMVARAEHAERTREEEAARRVAEERVRIARDLHDLLAHSITLIGVQTSVASHVLSLDPERLDRAAIAKALDDIAETCRTARGELRTTLTVLRTDQPDHDGPLPDLSSLPELVTAAGAELTLGTGDDRTPPAVGAAAYRIVQESLTNAVRHGGPGARIAVSVERQGPALRVTVTDDGDGSASEGGVPGYGIVGMRERARSVGGTLSTGPRDGGGFQVTALLPLQQPEAFA